MPIEDGLTGLLRFLDLLIQQTNTRLQRAQEALFLLTHHLSDELATSDELGVSIAHRLDEYGQEAVHEGLSTAEEGVAVADSTAQDTADDIASLSVGGELTIGDSKGNRTDMVGDDAHSDIRLLISAIFDPRERGDSLDHRGEDIGIIVRRLPLHSHTETLEAHPRIDDALRQWLERAICLTVVLHEDEVPDLDDLGVALVDQRETIDSLTLFVRADVDMDLRARAAGALITHLPEVVVLIPVDNALGRQVLCPDSSSLIIALKAFGGSSLKDRHIEALGGEVEYLSQIFPSPVNSFVLEVIPEGPVPKHLKHRVVIRIMAHLLEVVVLTAYAKALL